MLVLSTHPERLDPLPLGSVARVDIERQRGDIEVRALLAQRPLLYPRPLLDWRRDVDSVSVFPEAPGAYRIDIQWRAPGGDSGVESVHFRVVDPAYTQAESEEPMLVSLASGQRMWAPGSWDGRILEGSSSAMGQALERFTEPETAVYDIGANLGMFTVLLAEAVGARGAVYALEANPVCLQYLRSNVLRHALEQVEILPVAAVHEPGQTPFVLNYGNTNLGVSKPSGFFEQKVGHEITVPGYPLDQLIEDLRLRPPALVKIDVEGAEGMVLEGMARSLERDRPVLLLEIHHHTCAVEVLERLDRARYRYVAPDDLDRSLTSREVLDTLTGSVFQLVALPA